MWVRVIATAVAVWCVSGAAMAAGYTEVWNPPEASGHSAKHAKKTTRDAKVKSTAGAKAGSKHAAHDRHGAQRVASASKSGAGPSAHGSVKKVAARTGPAKPAVVHTSAPARSAPIKAGPADATANPATASSGSLPPILH